MNSSYYELRCSVLEMFFETLFEEQYTIGQAAARCLVEFRREVQGGTQEGLVVLSVLLSRVARHDPSVLADFAPEVGALRALAKKGSCWRGLDADEKERMKEDVRFAAEKAAAPAGEET